MPNSSSDLPLEIRHYVRFQGRLYRLYVEDLGPRKSRFHCAEMERVIGRPLTSAEYARYSYLGLIFNLQGAAELFAYIEPRMGVMGDTEKAPDRPAVDRPAVPPSSNERSDERPAPMLVTTHEQVPTDATLVAVAVMEVAHA